MSSEFPTTEVQSDGYSTDDLLPFPELDRVEPGTSLLISGRAMVGKRDLALALMAEGPRNGEPVVIVSPKESAGRVMRSYRSIVDDRGELYLVDASGSDHRQEFDDVDGVYYLSSPDDLTGVGISLVKATRAMGDRAEDGVRICLLSMSTVLQYTTAKRVFNFLHVMNNRVAATGQLGVATFDSTLHDDRTANTVRTLFDGAVDLREADDGRRECRVRGLSGVPREWRSL